MMAHAQKQDFVFRRNGVHLNGRGTSVQSIAGRRAVHISLQGLYCSCKPVFCCHVTLTGYPLHSLVSTSLLLPCVTVCHHISTGLYMFYLACGCFKFSCEFNIFLTVHLRIILVGNQLDAQFLLRYVYLNPLHVSNNYVLILRRKIV